MKLVTQERMDKLGIIASVGCLIHCLILPVILPALPMLGFSFAHSTEFHLWMAVVVTFIGTPVIIAGTTKTEDPRPAVMFVMGCIALFWGAWLEAFGGYPPEIMTVLGSLAVVTAHVMNHKLRCACKHHY